MTDIIAKKIADSIGPQSPRMFTVETRAPTMTHQETLRHRLIYIMDALGRDPDFSFSVSSTRAIPFTRMIAEAQDPALRAVPVHWGRAQGGMIPGEELDDVEKCIDWNEALSDALGITFVMSPDLITKRECCRRLWDLGASTSARIASTMVQLTDPHKSIPNRMIAPYLHYNVLMSGTALGWMNFFGLRLDGAADPIIRALAEAIWREWNESTPRKIEHGTWHLPYADDDLSSDEVEAWRRKVHADPAMGSDDVLQTLLRMSVARCAHLSYKSFETGERMTVDHCLKLYTRLVGGPIIHASPAEHQATPDEIISIPDMVYHGWKHPELGGNLGPGWIQLRKQLPGENLAPLPEAYR